jgi:hypothetical protein
MQEHYGSCARKGFFAARSVQFHGRAGYSTANGAAVVVDSEDTCCQTYIRVATVGMHMHMRTAVKLMSSMARHAVQ